MTDSAGKNRKATFIIALAFIGWGFTGITKHFVTAPTGFVSMVRAFGGAVMLFLLTLVLRRKISLTAIKKNALPILLSGLSLAVNWIALFHAYQLAGTGLATILDYLAPVIVFFLSPFFFRERISVRKVLIAFAAVLGVVMVAGAFSGAVSLKGEGFLLGLLLGLVSAISYAVFIICNKKARDVAPFDKGIAQLFVTGVLIIPYVLLKELPELVSYEWTGSAVLLLLFFILIQTPFAYGCYFYAVSDVPAQKSSIMSFIDPVITLTTAFLFLGESMDWIQALGSALILFAAFFIDFEFRKKKAA